MVRARCRFRRIQHTNSMVDGESSASSNAAPRRDVGYRRSYNTLDARRGADGYRPAARDIFRFASICGTMVDPLARFALS